MIKLHFSPLKPGRMQSSGSYLLRSLQNQSMVPLDLLVRESIQNSIDAGTEKTTGKVSVDFTIRNHRTENILDIVADGLDTGLFATKFPSGGQMLEIRDLGTEGLNGPLRSEDCTRDHPKGNLIRLVFDIGATRDEQSKGGSWGLGKTCYYRVGIGLVFFYSRTENKLGILEERLVACFIENELAEKRFMPSSEQGVAWWGSVDNGPVVDPRLIAGVLEKLGSKRFEGSETGTAVIIPFLKDDLIPQACSLSDDESDENISQEAYSHPSWFFNYESYLEVAIQRWYATRIDNPLFVSGPKLNASVNGSALRSGEMLPIFQVAQSLYNRTLTTWEESNFDYLTANGVAKSSIQVADVKIRGAFKEGMEAGRVAVALLNPSQMRMLPPDNNPHPLLCIFDPQSEANKDRPLVTYVRSPGMCIRWENDMDVRGWTGGTRLTRDNEILIAIFVPNTEKSLRDDLPIASLKDHHRKLEGYLRASEEADHHNWYDFAGQNIVSRIRQRTGKIIREFYEPKVRSVSQISIRDARNLADRLLPSGFGTDGRSAIPRPTPEPSGPSPKSSPRPVLKINGVTHSSKYLFVDWTLVWGRVEGERVVFLNVNSTTGLIDVGDWSDSRLGEFPFKIVGVELSPTFAHLSENCLQVGHYEFHLKPFMGDMGRIEIHGKLTIEKHFQSAETFMPSLTVRQVNTADGGVV